MAATVFARMECWVAEAPDRGIVGLLVLDDDWVDQLYVLPSWQGQGVGSALLEHAKRLRPDGLQLWTFASNLAAGRFYQRHGFVAVEQTDGEHNEERAPDVRYVWAPSRHTQPSACRHSNLRRSAMSSTDTNASVARLPFGAPAIAVAHFIVSADVERSRRFYTDVLGGVTVATQPVTYVALANSWIIIAVGGGPTDDKPTVTLETPPDPNRVTSFLNLRVADVHAAYSEWSARGAEFLTPPKQHEFEIRCYIRDPDGHIIEVGQTTLPERYLVEP